MNRKRQSKHGKQKPCKGTDAESLKSTAQKFQSSMNCTSSEESIHNDEIAAKRLKTLMTIKATKTRTSAVNREIYSLTPIPSRTFSDAALHCESGRHDEAEQWHNEKSKFNSNERIQNTPSLLTLKPTATRSETDLEENQVQRTKSTNWPVCKAQSESSLTSVFTVKNITGSHPMSLRPPPTPPTTPQASQHNIKSIQNKSKKDFGPSIAAESHFELSTQLAKLSNSTIECTQLNKQFNNLSIDMELITAFNEVLTSFRNCLHAQLHAQGAGGVGGGGGVCSTRSSSQSLMTIRTPHKTLNKSCIFDTKDPLSCQESNVVPFSFGDFVNFEAELKATTTTEPTSTTTTCCKPFESQVQNHMTFPSKASENLKYPLNLTSTFRERLSTQIVALKKRNLSVNQLYVLDYIQNILAQHISIDENGESFLRKLRAYSNDMLESAKTEENVESERAATRVEKNLGVRTETEKMLSKFKEPQGVKKASVKSSASVKFKNSLPKIKKYSKSSTTKMTTKLQNPNEFKTDSTLSQQPDEFKTLTSKEQNSNEFYAPTLLKSKEPKLFKTLFADVLKPIEYSANPATFYGPSPTINSTLNTSKGAIPKQAFEDQVAIGEFSNLMNSKAKRKYRWEQREDEGNDNLVTAELKSDLWNCREEKKSSHTVICLKDLQMGANYQEYMPGKDKFEKERNLRLMSDKPTNCLEEILKITAKRNEQECEGTNKNKSTIELDKSNFEHVKKWIEQQNIGDTINNNVKAPLEEKCENLQIVVNHKEIISSLNKSENGEIFSPIDESKKKFENKLKTLLTGGRHAEEIEQKVETKLNRKSSSNTSLTKSKVKPK